MTQNLIKTKAKYFIDTGTGEWGFTLMSAINSHFNKIYSIELSQQYYQKWASLLDPMNPRVTILHGNSSEIFPELIHQIPYEMMFSLNAHYTAKPDAKGDTYNSIWEELNSIQEHPIKNHTIMIPDIQMCGTIRFDFITLNSIIEKIKKINSKYKTFFINGRDNSQILIAQTENQMY